MRKFHHNETKFRKANLAYLANCSNFVYKDKQIIGKELKKLGFDISRDNYFISSSSTDTQAFIAGDNKKIIISFRGTEGTKISDWTINAQIKKEIWTEVKPLGKVHKGFHRALSSIWNTLLHEINILRNNNQSIWITGHSLGGALATLAAATLELQHKITINGVYTYGQPRIGNQTFSDNYNNTLKEKTHRCVNDKDIVSRVPSQITGYSHVGYLRYFNANGKLYTDKKLSWWARFWDNLGDAYDDIFSLPLEMIEDHKIDIYQELSERKSR